MNISELKKALIDKISGIDDIELLNEIILSANEEDKKGNYFLQSQVDQKLIDSPPNLTKEQDQELNRRFEYVEKNPEVGKPWIDFEKGLK